ncbi:MAG TPA: ABC transporter permease [Magnetospirillaceae bacterium]|jgi:simple sugar transport system permease protein
MSTVQSTRAGIGEWISRSAIFVLLAIMIVVFQVQEPAFLNVNNLFSILQAVSITALLGVGITVTLAVGGFDLSAGSVAAFAQMAASYVLVVNQVTGTEAVIIVLLIGAAIGIVNAILIVKVGVPDLLATLGTLFLLVGLELIPSGGHSISTGVMLPDGSTGDGKFPADFLALGRWHLGGVVPLPVIILAVIALIVWFVMERTRWGRVFYAIGGNETAARLAGAPTKKYRTMAYVISGVIASLGGILLAARIGRGDVSAGNSLLLDSVAAALIGYAVLGVNHPNVFGTVVGAVFVGVLLNGLTMLNAPYYAQDFVKGAVLVAALAVTFGLRRRRD